MNKIKGAAILIICVILMIAVILMMIFTTNNNMMNQKVTANAYRTNQALTSAEGGLEYAYAFLQENNNTIIATALAGLLNYAIALVNQIDDTTFDILINNPTITDFNYLRITSTGTSADGTATRTVVQDFYSIPASKNAITTKSTITTGGNTTISGTVNSGGAVSQGSNSTITTVIQNDTALANMTDDALFESVFDKTKTEIRNTSIYYNNDNLVVYPLLVGKNWINSNAKMNSNSIIGSVANPVLLVINGNLTGAGNVTFYGILYVMGTTKITGTLNLQGSLISEGSVSVSGNVSFNRNAVQNYAGKVYGKIPGSWRDF